MAATTVFSTTLQRLRKEKGVTQEQLANHLGVSPQAVSKWENGSYPEGDLLPKISEFFDVSISYLYGQETENVSLEQEIMNELRTIMQKHEEDGKSGSNHPEYIDKALDIVWAFQIGFWKNNTDYWKRGVPSPDIRNASSITDDSGFGYFNMNKEREFYTLVREPEGGFAENIKITSRMRKFYEVLGKPGTLEILFFMLTLKQSEYVTVDNIARNIGLPVELVEKRINELGPILDTNGNPNFYFIDVLEKDGSKKAFGVNFASVCNYISFFLLTDTIINTVHGFQMQVNSRYKSYFDREKVVKMIEEYRKENGKTV